MADPTERLTRLRAEIDEIDEASRVLRAQRFRVTREIGRIKVASKLPLVDDQREAEIIEEARAGGVRHDLDPDMEARLARTVMDQVGIEHQRIADEASDLDAAS